jgi:hypothetical protein
MEASLRPTPNFPPDTAPLEAVPNRPQETEGFFNEEQTLDTAMEEIVVKELKSDTYRGGTTQLDRLTMGDGSQYERLVTTPTRANLTSDTYVSGTTPWWARLDGFITDTTRKLAKRGQASALVAPKGCATSHGLPKALYHMDVINKHTVRGSDMRPDAFVGLGISRAAALVLGLRGLQYAESLGPCYPEAMEPKDLPKDALQLGVEAFEIGKHALLGHGPVGILRHRRTFSLHPEHIWRSLLAIPGFINGDAGRLPFINPDAHSMVTVKEQDVWSRAKAWDEVAKHLPNMTVRHYAGKHGSYANPRTLEPALARIEALAEERGFDGDFADVDFDRIKDIEPTPKKRSLLIRPLGRLAA